MSGTLGEAIILIKEVIGRNSRLAEQDQTAKVFLTKNNEILTQAMQSLLSVELTINSIEKVGRRKWQGKQLWLVHFTDHRFNINSELSVTGDTTDEARQSWEEWANRSYSNLPPKVG